MLWSIKKSGSLKFSDVVFKPQVTKLVYLFGTHDTENCWLDMCHYHIWNDNLKLVVEARCEKVSGDSNQGGSKHGRCTFGISCEDCHAQEISRFVGNICLR